MSSALHHKTQIVTAATVSGARGAAMSLTVTAAEGNPLSLAERCLR